MEDLQIFRNEEFGTVRSVVIEGEPWFVGKDVAEILGYKDTADALQRHVDDDDKLTRCFTQSGQSRNMYVVNESGLYSLILRSQLPEAKRFKRWVTSEVLPTIRKTGTYAVDSYQIEDPIDRAKKWIEEQEEKKILQLQVAIQGQQIAELQPKASYYDLVLNSPDLLSITEIAKDYGWSAHRMNQFLNNLGIQYKKCNLWLLYQKYAEQGLTSTKTHAHPASDGSIHTSVHTYWTQKGRLFIYDLLKEHGILPIIELPEYDFKMLGGGCENDR